MKRLMVLMSSAFFVFALSACGGGGGGGGGDETGTTSSLPRFTDNANGTVTDNLTKLVWLRRVDCFRFTSTSNTDLQTWSEAMALPNLLASGSCELTDGSIAGDWRLPTIVELESLLLNPPMPSVNPFRKSDSLSVYWSSTTDSLDTDRAWGVKMTFGKSMSLSKLDSFGVWPVRNRK